MNSLGAGDSLLDLVGPLGKASEVKNYGTVVVIGGGVGAAIAYPTAKALHEAGNHVIAVLGAGAQPRRYERHWTPVHLDVVVENVAAALAKALAAGAIAETGIKIASWGKIGILADPFGHGICLIEFLGRGYDEIAERVGPG